MNILKLIRKLLFNDRCSYCGEVIENGYLCEKCKKRLEEMSELKKRDNIYFLFFYNDFKKIILDYKFRNRRKISKFLNKLIEPALKKIILEEKIDMVIPIPISEERRRERGFNQVEEILKESGIHYINIKRIKKTKYMNKMKRKDEREKNIRNSFEVEKDSFSYKKILIVDDILTTGSTLNELKRVILETNKEVEIVFFSFSVVKKYFKE